MYKQEPTVAIKFVPVLFVLLWSTGFVGAKFTLPYIEPLTLLAVRMTFAALLLGALAVGLRSAFPGKAGALHSMLAGALIHVMYLGGVFVAISMGMSAGLSALIVGLQPILTAVISWLIYQESLQPRQVGGLALGLVGVALVVGMQEAVPSEPLAYSAYLLTLISLVGITVGTIYQKRHCGGVDLIAGMFFQYLSAAILYALLAWSLETQSIDYTPQLVAGLLWMVVALSFLSVWLLMILIRRGHSTKVASYFYLVPGVTALMAWAMFNETLSKLAILGMLLAAAGVYLVVKTETR